MEWNNLTLCLTDKERVNESCKSGNIERRNNTH